MSPSDPQQLWGPPLHCGGWLSQRQRLPPALSRLHPPVLASLCPLLVAALQPLPALLSARRLPDECAQCPLSALG